MVSTRTQRATPTNAKSHKRTQRSQAQTKRVASSSTTKEPAKKRAKKETPSYLLIPPNSPNLTTPLLHHLPRELFHHITSFLAPDSQTLLSLTCKSILHLIGTDPWTQCRSKRQFYDGTCWVNHRQHLMPLLVKDLDLEVEGKDEGMVYCDVCMALHPPLKPPREHKETRVTRGCLGPWCLIDYLPKKEDGGGYSLLWNHIFSARKSLTSSPGLGTPIELLAGDFTIPYSNLNYNLKSSGRQVGRNLVLKHQHIFQCTKAKTQLKAGDMLALPLQICPHQTTSTKEAGENMYTKGKLPSGLLMHSITTAFPAALRMSLPAASKFCVPTASDQKQMDTFGEREDGMWSCRACPTKWKVIYSGAGKEVKVVVWHSFGDTAYRAQEYWKMFVRREMSLLRKEKRNSEFFVITRQFLDFEVDEEEDLSNKKTDEMKDRWEGKVLHACEIE